MRDISRMILFVPADNHKAGTQVLPTRGGCRGGSEGGQLLLFYPGFPRGLFLGHNCRFFLGHNCRFI